MEWKIDASGRCFENEVRPNHGSSKPDFLICIQPQLLPAIKFLFKTDDKNQMSIKSEEELIAEDVAPLDVNPSATGMQNAGVGDSGSGHFINVDGDYIIVGISKSGSAVAGAYGHMLKLTDKNVNQWIKEVAEIKNPEYEGEDLKV